MHELSYMIKFIEMAKKAIENEPYTCVESITVEVGEMTGVLPVYLEKYFPQVVKDTPFEGASLEVISVPVKAKCSACNNIYAPDKTNNYACPECKRTDAKIISGRELNLVNVAVSLQ